MDVESIYENLANHLNRLPAGFPRTESGVEMRILRRLFTPEEAALAPLLSLKPESPAEIAARSGRPAEEMAEKLEEMARQGLIFRLRKGAESRYMAAQFLIGIWEYHVNDLDPDLIRDMNEYIPHFFDHSYHLRTPQLRTIPVPGAITATQSVMPYEEARRIIAEQEKIIVAPCICRKEHQMMGHGCDRPLESCLVFGAGATYYEDNGLGRAIDQDEALRILERAEQAGLVLQPSNAQKVVNICTCCGCCCQILKNLKRLPNPAEFVASNYYASVDRDRCSGCETCLERCQMDAIRMEGGMALVDEGQCIGCGLCVPTVIIHSPHPNPLPKGEREPQNRSNSLSPVAGERVGVRGCERLLPTCPDEAIALLPKAEDKRHQPPRHFMETYLRIARERMAKQQP